jgi:hypothetical protein
MNPDDNLNMPMGSVVCADDGNLKMVTPTGMVLIPGQGASGLTYTGNGSAGATITHGLGQTVIAQQGYDIDDFLDAHIMNRVTVDYKVSEHELLKLKEVAPDYANEIKENIAKDIARDISKKITYTKKHDKDSDVHHFIGRVWSFTEDELKNFILEAQKCVR